jgi:hypothetical protein
MDDAIGLRPTDLDQLNLARVPLILNHLSGVMAGLVNPSVGATLMGANLKGLWVSPYTLPVIARLDRAIQ